MTDRDLLSVEDVLQASTLAAYSPPDFSPDNRLLAYVVTDNARRREAFDRKDLLRAGVPWFGIAADIWISDLENGDRRNLTEGAGNSWWPRWSPDARYLAFLSDRGGGGLGPARLWVWEHASDRLREVGGDVGAADLRECLSGIHWADHRSMLVSLFPEDLGREGFASLIRGEVPSGSDDSGVTAKVFEFDPSLSESVPSTDQVNPDLWRQDLGLIDVETGDLRRLTRGLRIAYQSLSADRSKVAYTLLQGADEPGSGRYLYDIAVLDLATGESRTLASTLLLPLFGNTFSWSPDSDLIAWRTGGPSVSDEVHVVEVESGMSRRVADGVAIDELTAEVEAPVWDRSGKNLFFVREGALWRAPVEGSGAAIFAKSDGRELRIIAPRQGRLFAPDESESAVVLSTEPSTKRIGLSRIDLASGGVSSIFEEDKRYGGYSPWR